MIKEFNDIDYLNKLSNYKITLNPFNKILVYVLDEKIVAFIDYSIMYENIEINYIYVLEEYRKNNIASKLIEYVINNYEFNNITLEVSVLNEPAIKLYNKFEFKIIGKRLKYYDGIDAYLMERRKI